jgi:hypothetical protein
MLVFECPSCKAKMRSAEENAGKSVACPSCKATTKVPAAPKPADDAITADIAPATASPKPDAITTPDQARSTKKAAGKRDDDDDDDDDDRDDDRPRRRKRSSGDSTAVAAAGMGIGMILLLVFGIGACILCVPAILIALLVPAVQKVREAAARTQTMNNMKQIALAAHNHHDMTKMLPSPKMQPQQPGGPAPDLSWRVTILPFIEQQAIFQTFDKTNAWDHPNNARFMNTQIITYMNVVRPEPGPGQTTFQYFTGPNTLWPDPLQKRSLMDITDGTSNTFLFAEAQTPVPWSKPADMVIAPAGPLPLPPDRFLAAMADGSVRLVNRSNVNEQTLRLVINPTDGQPLPMDWDR